MEKTVSTTDLVYLQAYLDQVKAQVGDWRAALERAEELVENALEVER